VSAEGKVAEAPPESQAQIWQYKTGDQTSSETMHNAVTGFRVSCVIVRTQGFQSSHVVVNDYMRS